MMRLGSPTIALLALTNGRPFHVYDHAEINKDTFIKNLKKDVKKKHRVLAFEWDNEYEEKVSGRLLSISSTAFSVAEVNEK